MPESKIIQMPPPHDPVLDNVIRVHKVELLSVDDMKVRDLFSGFDTLRAITFSVGMDFVDRIAGLFSYLEILVGAEFLVRRNAGLHDAFYQARAAEKLAEEIPGKYPNVMDRMRSGSFQLKVANVCLDHRKIYILSAKDGRTRVVAASANMSGAAWSGDHLELYVHDDSRAMYDAAMRQFDAGWAMSSSVPYQAAKVKPDDLIDGSLAIRKNIEVNNMLVVPAQEGAMTREVVEYVVRQDDLADEYESAFKDVLKLKGTVKDKLYRIVPAHLERAAKALSEARNRRAMELEIVQKDYPSMEFDYSGGEPGMKLDGEPVDFHPDEAAVRADIDNLMTIFGHFDDGREFIGNLAGLRDNYWKFLVYMLMSPHMAKLRCAAYANGITETSMPLFAVLTSRQPNTGKTFMVEAVLRLMTGRRIPGSKGEGEGVAKLVRAVQAGVKCTPYLFDEVSSKSFGTSIKKEVKNVDLCERSGRQQQPVIVFTSNDMADPDDAVRKRSIHLVFDAALRSDVDQNAFRTQGNRLKERFTGALYREFTRRALPGICGMISDIYSGAARPDTWYPDVFALSSRVFLEILEDYGYQAPPYMRPLTWNEDYYAVRKASENTVSEIQALYALNPGIFKLDGEFVTINLGLDPGKQKLMKSWYNTLPPEARADCYTSRDDGAVLRVNLRELERLGFRRKGLRRAFPFFRWRR